MSTPDQHNFAIGLDASALPAVVDRATWQAELDTTRKSGSGRGGQKRAAR